MQNENLGQSNMFEEQDMLETILHKISFSFRKYLDKSVLYQKERWIFSLAIISIYFYRIILYGGFYVMTYIIGLLSLHFTLQLFLPVGFPDIDDEEENADIMELPINLEDQIDPGEFKPIVRIFSEYKFWESLTLAFLCGNLLISFDLFDLPVFWPFLLIYFVIICFLSFKKLYNHMNKYGYGIFNKEKPTYEQDQQQEEK